MDVLSRNVQEVEFGEVSDAELFQPEGSKRDNPKQKFERRWADGRLIRRISRGNCLITDSGTNEGNG